MRKELKLGLLFTAVLLVLQQTAAAPEFIMGILAGLAISLEIIGMLSEERYQKFKSWKQNRIKAVKSSFTAGAENL